MTRRLLSVFAVLAVLLGGVAVASTPAAPASELKYVTLTAGDTWTSIIESNGFTCSSTVLRDFNNRGTAYAGRGILVPPSCTSPVVTPPTTTTPPPTTTTPPPTTTTPPPTTTTPPVVSVGFVETFTGNVGLDRFERNVWNREGSASGSVSADHDLACGAPDTQRTVFGADPSSSFYLCRDHLMTAVGDWSGYSVGWFRPNQMFTTETKVSWDVNVTDLGARQWWEVAIVPASYDSGFPGCRYCAVQTWLSPDPAHLPGYPSSAIVVGNGAFGNTVNIHAGGQDRFSGWQKTCGQSWDLFQSSGACESKMTRIPFSITENSNGTVTVNYGGVRTETFPGSFPSEFVVIFKDHNYTPDKDGVPVGHTWHWDNIIVT